MKRLWTVEELIEQWPVSSTDRELLYRKETTGRLGLVAQLAFFRLYARFPEHRSEFAPVVIDHLAEQIGVLPSTLDGYEWDDRTGRRHREAILGYLHITPFAKMGLERRWQRAGAEGAIFPASAPRQAIRHREQGGRGARWAPDRDATFLRVPAR